MNTARAVLVIAMLGAAVGGCATAQTSNEPAELKLDNLLVQSLAEEFVPDREVVVSYVEIPPNTTLDRHWHPGEEFIYVLEGEAEVAIADEEGVIGAPGTVVHVPYATLHTAITRDQAAKAVVFRVHTKGEPVRYLEEGGSTEQ